MLQNQQKEFDSVLKDACGKAQVAGRLKAENKKLAEENEKLVSFNHELWKNFDDLYAANSDLKERYEASLLEVTQSTTVREKELMEQMKSANDRLLSKFRLNPIHFVVVQFNVRICL